MSWKDVGPASAPQPAEATAVKLGHEVASRRRTTNNQQPGQPTVIETAIPMADAERD